MIRGSRSGVVLALVVSVGLLVGACGSGSSSSKSEASPTPTPTPEKKIASVDACSLVKVDEATAVAGTTVTNMATSGGASVPGACIYVSADSKASVFVFGEVLPDATAAQTTSPEQIAAAMNGAVGISSAKPVSGIGDKAVEYGVTSAQGSGMAIFVVKANVILLIAVSPDPGSAKLEDLARTAVSRL